MIVAEILFEFAMFKKIEADSTTLLPHEGSDMEISIFWQQGYAQNEPNNIPFVVFADGLMWDYANLSPEI